METSLIFVIIIMFYLCIIFPLQMRHYIKKRQRRLNAHAQRPQTTVTNTRRVRYLNNRNRNVRSPTEQSDENLVFGALQIPPPVTSDARREDEIAAARHLEAEHRQQIIDIQRVIEQEAIRRPINERPNSLHIPPRLINSSTNHEEAEYRQQIIDLQREIEQQAIEQHRNAPHIPSRLINSSTIRSSIYTITSDSVIGVSNTNVNYPYGPPATPGDRLKHFPIRSMSKDDELPSYDQAVAYDSTTTCGINKYDGYFKDFVIYENM